MNLKSLSVMALLMTTSSAMAQTSVQDSIVQQLQDQGFNRIEIRRTFLGRVRIEAYSDTMERELVFNPKTGEVLRDYWEERDDDEDFNDDDDEEDEDDEDLEEDDEEEDDDDENEDDEDDEDDEEDDDDDDDEDDDA